MRPDQEVVVLGGTGFLGKRVVRNLKEHGHRVVIGTRFPEKVSPNLVGRSSEIRVAQMDLNDPMALRQAFRGTAAVINCIGFYWETSSSSFTDVHVSLAGRIAEAVMATEKCRLIHVSGIGASSASPSAYVRARATGDETVRCLCPPATILRPSVMFSRDGAFFGNLEAIVRKLPVVPVFGNGATRLQPVHVGDVAEAVRRTLEQDNAKGTVYELGGPEAFTYREILQRLAARTGRRRIFLPVPFVVWWALACLAEKLPSPPLTTGQVALMGQDNLVGNDVPTFADLGIDPRSAIGMKLL